MPFSQFILYCHVRLKKRPANMQAGRIKHSKKRYSTYTRGILLWILNVRALFRIFHKSIRPNRLLKVSLSLDNCFESLPFSTPVSCDATLTRGALLLFIILFIHIERTGRIASCKTLQDSWNSRVRR
jgi:hypothetical protein